MSGVRRFILAGVTVGILAILFVQIAAPLIAAMDGGAASGGTTTAEDAVPVLGGSATVESASDESVSDIRNVRSTLADAVELTGASDSSVDIQASPAISKSHEVCTFATADSAAVSNNETRVLYHVQDMVLFYNGSTDDYEVWYYDESSRESAIVNVAANDATSRTLVCGQYNATSSNLTVYRNTTQGTVELMDGNQTTDVPPDNNWDGEIDETRIYNRTLNSSQRSELNTTPALAVTGEEPQLRITYDSFQASPSSLETFFASGGADLSNASLVSGVAGPSLSEGTDYSTSGDTISVLSGGVLDDDGEVVYAEYNKTSSGLKSTAISVVTVGAEMLPVVVIAVVSAAILIGVRRLQV